MNTYQIRAKKDLYNAGKCFTKNKLYSVETGRTITTEASLYDCETINDLGEKHGISSLWRDFELIVGNIASIPAERFIPESYYTIANAGGIEIMLNRSCDGVYYRFNYGNPDELIYEAEIEHGTDEQGEAISYFTHRDIQYNLNQFMRV